MDREYDKEHLREVLDNFLLFAPGRELASGRVALTCTLLFRNAHLPEVQEAVCECAKEYIALIGPEAKSSISGSPARFHLAKNGKVSPPKASTFRNAQEKGRPTATYRVFSHASGEEFDSLPPTFSLYIYMQLNKKRFYSFPMERMTSVFSAVFAPSFFLLDRSFEDFSALVHKWCDALRPHSGVAGWGISRQCDDMNCFVMPGSSARELLRFPGLDYIRSSCFSLKIRIDLKTISPASTGRPSFATSWRSVSAGRRACALWVRTIFSLAMTAATSSRPALNRNWAIASRATSSPSTARSMICSVLCIPRSMR